MHVHLHLPDDRSPRRAGDANAGAPGERAPSLRRPRDQGEEGPRGALLCRIAQHGQSGDWFAEDAEGRPLVVRHGNAGLEVYAGEPANGDAGDPDVTVTGVYPGTASPGAAHDAAALRRQQRHGFSQRLDQQYAALRGWSEKIAAFYAKK
jgi:hypothetical protein